VYNLHPSFFVVSALRGLLFLGFFVGGVFGFTLVFQQARAIVHDVGLWERGVASSDASFEGTSTSQKFIFHEYKLGVTYEEPNGAVHKGHTEFSTVWSRLDETRAIEVHFDPNHPEEFVMSAAVELVPARWVSVVVFLAGAAGLIFIGALAIANGARALRQGLRAARDGMLIGVTLSGAPSLDQRGNKTYRYRTEDDESREYTWTFRRKRGPLVVSEGRVRLVALRSQQYPEAIVLLRSDLYPLALPRDEVERIVAAVAGGKCRSYEPLRIP